MIRAELPDRSDFDLAPWEVAAMTPDDRADYLEACGLSAEEEAGDTTAESWPAFTITFYMPDGTTRVEVVTMPDDDGRGAEGARYWAAGYGRTSGARTWTITDAHGRVVG